MAIYKATIEAVIVLTNKAIVINNSNKKALLEIDLFLK